MEDQYHYATVTDAINKLREKGFTIDFNLEENCLVCHDIRIGPDDFEIVEVYRYEGNSDPGDEAVVYGIASSSGQKGILVAGYGASSDSLSTEMLKKLSFRS